MEETLVSLTDEELTAHEVQIKQKLEVIDSKLGRLKAQKSQLLQWQENIQNIRRQRRTNQQTGENDWEGESFAWSSQARQLLQQVFAVQEFRPKQLPTINALMSGNDVLLLAPTGGGKSLCFQLPALLSDGLTVVISPLISLMEDQVWSLDKLRINAQLLCSATDKVTVSRVHKELSDKSKPTLKLLYVTPERLSKSKRFMTALQKCYNNGHLDRFAIDEVHCCSQWGHDFRPDYKFLGVLKEMFPKAPILGVTATATTKVIVDVQKMLNIPEALLFVASFNRPNLYYHVLSKPGNKQKQYDLLSDLLAKRFRQQSGIIYTYSMKEAVDISSELGERGLKVAPYHANLEPADRSKIHQLWHNAELQAVAATVAFGMGINKPDVRFVIHHTMSKSMENFYQESGRAGRDGKRADCILLYHFADMFRISTMTFSEHTGLRNAYAMVEYCISTNECRRKLISRYFSEVWGDEDCNAMCDCCVNSHVSRPMVDITMHLSQLGRIVEKADTEQVNLTALKLVDAWMQKGPTNVRLEEPAPLLDRAIAEQILVYFIVKNYLRESFVYTPYATLSYIKRGPEQTADDGLKLRLGKLFPLPAVASTSNGHTPTNVRSKKRSNASPAVANGSRRTNGAKRGRSKTPASEEEEVSIVQNNVEVIEIDAD